MSRGEQILVALPSAAFLQTSKSGLLQIGKNYLIFSLLAANNGQIEFSIINNLLSGLAATTGTHN